MNKELENDDKFKTNVKLKTKPVTPVKRYTLSS